MDDEKFKRIEFLTKYLVMAVAGVWTLLIGTGWIQKQSAEVTLSKNEYELEAAKLGNEGLYPKASTELTLNANDLPWGKENNLCTVTGNYIIENIGGFPILVESVEFAVYEILPIGEEDLNELKVLSFSLSPKLNSLTPIHKESMEVNENITTSNRLERSFGYVIKINKGALYSINASAKGKIPGATGEIAPLSSFSENDLTHISGSQIFCPEPSNKSSNSDGVNATDS